jgi:outer membrane protein TolC
MTSHHSHIRLASWFCAAAVALMGAAVPAPADTLACTLERYIADVLAGNQELQIRQYRVRQAQAQTVAVRRSEPFTFSTSLNNDISRRLSTDIMDSVNIVRNRSNTIDATVSKKFITGTTVGLTYEYSFADGNSRRMPSGLRDYHSTNLNVSLSQPLLAGLTNIAFRRDLQGARLDESITILDCRNLTADVAFRAINAYFTLQKLQHQRTIKQHGLELTRQSLAAIETLVQKRFEKMEKLLQRQSALLEKENELYALENELQENQARFLDLLNTPTTIDTIVLETAPRVPVGGPAVGQLDSLLKVAMVHRIDYRSAMETLNKARNNLAVARSNALPNLSLNGNYYIYGTDPHFGETFARMGSQNYNSWSAGFSFTTPIDVKYRKNKTFPLEIAEKEAAFRVESVRKKIRQELMAVLNKISLNCRQHTTSSSSLAIARRNLEEARELYGKGFMGADEYLENQKNSELSEFGIIKSGIEYTINYYDLLKVQGILIDTLTPAE